MRVAYLFERFPSFGQTFCYREVTELLRQGVDVPVFSVRRPTDEPLQVWDREVLARVIYLPEERELIPAIEQEAKNGNLPEAATHWLKEWGRQSDFLRLYQAAYLGLRLREAGLDRIHAHFAGLAARTAYWLKLFFGIEYSLTVHANDIFAPRDFVVSLSKLFETARAIVTVSDFAVARLAKQFPANAGKLHRVYNGITLADFKTADFRGETPVILSVGRLIEKKGFGDLIAACKILREHGRNFRCEIIGEGPLERALAQQILADGLQDCVRLIGSQRQSEIIERLAAAHLFVLACRADVKGDMDNLPTVIMEAMAAGLPVVSTTLAGVPEMVQGGVTGELVAPGDIDALARTMGNLLSKRDLLRVYGKRGQEMAAEKFSIERNVAALAEILAL